MMEINQSILNLINPDNNVRKNSEVFIENSLKENTNNFIKIILDNLNNENGNLVEMSLLILQKNIILKKEIYEKLNENDINIISQKCTCLIVKGKKFSILKRLAEILVNIFVKMNQVQLLLNNLKNIDYKNDKNLKLFIVYSLELISDFGFLKNDRIDNYHEIFVNYFNELINDPDLEVQVNTAKSLCEFFSNIENEQILDKYKSSLQVLLDLLIKSIKENQDIGAKMLKCINDIILFKPKFLKEKYDYLLNILGEIIINNNFTFECRNLSISIVCTMAEVNKVFLRSSEVFQKEIIPKLIRTATEMDDNIEEILSSETTLNESISQAIVAQAAQLSFLLTISYFLPKCLPFLLEGIKSNNWKLQVGCLSFLGNISENIGSKFKNDIPELLNLIIPLLNSENELVYYNAIHMLGLLTFEYSPELQLNYHSIILPTILNKFKNSKYDKIKNINISFLINYYRDITSEDEAIFILEQYLNNIMEILFSTIEYSISNSKSKLFSETISLIGILANSYSNKFEVYYDKIMPFLINFIQNPEYSIDSKVSCIDTAGLLLITLKGNISNRYQEFNKLFDLVYNIAIKSQKDDLILKPIINLFKNLCSQLKDNFYNFAEKIFELVYKLSLEKVELVINDSKDETNNGKKMETLKIDLKIYGEKNISINQHLIDNKYLSMELLVYFIKYLKEKIFKFNNQIFEVIDKNIDCFYSGARNLSFKMLYQIMKLLNNQDEIEMLNSKYLNYIIKRVNEALKTHDVDKIIPLIKYTHKCLSKQKIAFKNNQIVSDILNTNLEIFNLNRELIKELESELTEGSDPELVEEIRDEISYHNEMLQNMLEINKDLILIYHESIEEQILNKFGNLFLQLLNDENNYDNVEYGILFLADLLDVGSTNLFNKLWKDGYQKSIYYFNKFGGRDNNYQNVSFILGLISIKLDNNSFSQIKNDVINILNTILNQNNCYSIEKVYGTENAIASLGKISLTHDPIYLNDFLNRLPLQNDLVESKFVNKLLLDKLNSDPNYFVNSQNELKQALIKISSCKKKILNEEYKQILNQKLNN